MKLVRIHTNMRLFWVIIPILLIVSMIGIVGVQESFAEEFSLDAFDFTLQGGSLMEIENDSHASSIILRVEMDVDGIIILSKTHRISANPDCTPSDGLFVLIDGEEVGYDINNNDHSLSIKIPKDSKEIEIISTWYAVVHTTPSMYAEFCKALDDGKHLSPYAQTKIGFLTKDVICKDDLELVFKSSDDLPACVKPSTVEKLIQRDWTKNINNMSLDHSVDVSCTTKLDQEKKTYSVRYDITNAQITNAERNANLGSLILSILPESDGSLYVELPRGLIDAKHDLQDDDFFVLHDGEEIKFEEITTTDEFRLLEIIFNSTVKEIEIIGTVSLPISDTVNTCD